MGQNLCEFSLDDPDILSLFPASCKTFTNTAIFAVAFCDNTEVKTVFGNFDRDKLAVLAVCFDVAIILVFCIAIVLMK